MDDDDWGEDLDLDMVEECVILASQATSSTTNHCEPLMPAQPTERPSFQFKSPPPPPAPSATSLSSSSSSSSDQLDRLRAENRRLNEENLVKSGESSILRADVLHLRQAMEQRDQEANQKLAVLKKHSDDVEARLTKQLEASRTEIKFKELELEELRSRCKRVEAASFQAPSVSPFAARAPPPGHAKESRPAATASTFLNRSLFETSGTSALERSHRTGVQVAVQTEPTDRSPNGAGPRRPLLISVTALVDSLVHSLTVLQHDAGDGATPEATLRQLLELVAELRFRLADAGDPTATSQAAASGATVARLVCTRLHLLKNAEVCAALVDFLCVWIVDVLPAVAHKDGESDSTVASQIVAAVDKVDVGHGLKISAALVAAFSLQPLCLRPAGCLLEWAALRVKETYGVSSEERQFQLASALVAVLSALLASGSGDEMPTEQPRCACIPHLLRALALTVDHVKKRPPATAGGNAAGVDWRTWLLRVFRLATAVLRCQRQPWLTFTASQSELNRLFSVLTTLTELALPPQLAHEINVTSFATGMGFH